MYFAENQNLTRNQNKLTMFKNKCQTNYNFLFQEVLLTPTTR